MHRVRLAVRENRLTSRSTEEDYIPAIEETGRGWVVEVDGGVVGFAVGNAATGNVWALFVEPAHEGQGHGRRLHDAMVEWLFSRGLERLWLSTIPTHVPTGSTSRRDGGIRVCSPTAKQPLSAMLQSARTLCRGGQEA